MKELKNKLSTGKLILVVVCYVIVILCFALFFLNRSRGITDDLLAGGMIDVARCASATVDGDQLASIVSDDKSSQAYQNVFTDLSCFLYHTEAKYIYAMRYDRAKDRFYFVVDTDPVDPGVFGEEIKCTQAMAEAQKGTPSVDSEAYQDRWGSFYSAYCPVYASTGEMAGIIGVDYPADWYEGEVSKQTVRVILICIAAVVLSAVVVLLLIWQARRESAFRIRERDELEVARADATEANSDKNRFLANMSREVRTPIDTILNMDEMILRESVEVPVREYATDIRHAGNELLALMDELLDMSRIESEEAEINPVRYDPVLLISDLSDMMKMRIRDKNIQVYNEIDDKLPSILLGDSLRIKQCLINLISNAVKYTEEGEIHLSVERIKIKDNSVWLRYSVRDTGVGIAEDEVGKILDAIEDINNVRHTSSADTAMGLRIVHRVLKAMDSRLEFNSVLGKGSTFFFTLRQKVIDERPVGEYEKAREVMEIEGNSVQHKPYTAPDARILAVDDAKMNLKLVQQLLVDTKIVVDTTDSGAMALEMLAQTTYDILIFDHLMPEIDGIELLRLVRENRENPNCNKPCIVLTGNTVDGAREEYLRVGFDAYLSKPVNKNILQGVLLRYLPADKVKMDPYGG